METGKTSDWQRRMSKLPVDTLMFSLTIRQEEETIVSKRLISIQVMLTIIDPFYLPVQSPCQQIMDNKLEELFYCTY